MAKVSRIGPDMPRLAQNIASGLMADLQAQRLSKCGIDEVRAAIRAREQVATMGAAERDQLETLTLRKLVLMVG